MTLGKSILGKEPIDMNNNELKIAEYSLKFRNIDSDSRREEILEALSLIENEIKNRGLDNGKE